MYPLRNPFRMLGSVPPGLGQLSQTAQGPSLGLGWSFKVRVWGAVQDFLGTCALSSDVVRLRVQDMKA